MFETIGTILRAISSLVTSLVGITQSIDNVVASTNHATNALKSTAEELDNDVAFTCQKKQATRTAAILKYEKELSDLE